MIVSWGGSMKEETGCPTGAMPLHTSNCTEYLNNISYVFVSGFRIGIGHWYQLRACAALGFDFQQH